ncbi:MAG TPA: thioredoxin TrxC [Noviherbaspirillum sp.]
MMHIVCPHCHSTNRVPETRLGEHPDCGRCKQPLFTGRPLNLDAASFERHLQRNELPLLVDFWAPWCGPCRMMAPAFEQAAAALEPQFRLIKVNTDEEQALGARYQIRSIPTLMLFSHGRETARQPGAMGLGDILRWARQAGA